jgi:hypothetical protein
MRLRSVVTPCLALALVASGCGDAAEPSTTSGPITLNATEINQLLGEIATTVGQAEGGSLTRDPRLSFSRTPAPTLSREVAITDSFNCSAGGGASLAGTSDTSSFDVAITFTDCRTTHYTVNGRFHRASSITSTSAHAAGDGDLNIKTADGRSGSCHIDFQATATLATLGVSVTGTVCGVSAASIPAVSLHLNDAIALSAAEVNQLFTEISALFNDVSFSRVAGVAPQPSPSGPPGVSFSAMVAINASVSCPGGGSATFTGNDLSSATSINLDITVTFATCRTAHYQVDGKFRETVTGSFGGQNDSYQAKLAGDLTVRVLSDSRTGTCHMDITDTITATSSTATGTICGQSAAGIIS